MQCGCQQSFQVENIEELEGEEVFAKFSCQVCGCAVGVEGTVKNIDLLVPAGTWSDEAKYHLSRLPPYLVPLVLEEVETYSRNHEHRILTYARLVAARNKGMVEWSPEAERRLTNVPSGIRTMAKTELERTALDRGMSEVTVGLMEEVKTRYFGMAAAR